MAEKAADEEIPSTTRSIPSSEEDPPPPTTDAVEEKKPTEETDNNDFDTTVDDDQPKKKRRRKNCPISLDNFETIKQSANNSGFSFTFDTPFCSTPDSTPKFGSFDITRCTQIQPKSEVIKPRSEELQREEEEKSEVSTSIVVGEVIRSVDGVVESGVD